MNRVLQYGPLRVRVESDMPITIPLPLEHGAFPMWIPPMEVRIQLRPLTTPLEDERREIPCQLRQFYSVMEELKISCLPPERHCNPWWQENGVIHARFPYMTDRFSLSVFPAEKKVEIFGNEKNLNRVILDLLSCYASLPPLHGAAFQKDGRAFLLLAGSGGGKTRAIQELLECGYTYIADEEVFWNGDRVLCCGQVIVGKDGWEDCIPQKVMAGDAGCPVSGVFLLTKGEEDQRSPVLMPFIARQSFWAQALVAPEHCPDMIHRLKKAKERYEGILGQAKRISVDHSRFHLALEQIIMHTK